MLAPGLVVSEVEVPRYLLLGQKAVLKCHYRLEGDSLYSLTWWKDGRQFYSYIPSNNPTVVVFDVPDVTVNVSVLYDVVGQCECVVRCRKSLYSNSLWHPESDFFKIKLH